MPVPTLSQCWRECGEKEWNQRYLLIFPHDIFHRRKTVSAIIWLQTSFLAIFGRFHRVYVIIILFYFDRLHVGGLVDIFRNKMHIHTPYSCRYIGATDTCFCLQVPWKLALIHYSSEAVYPYQVNYQCYCVKGVIICHWLIKSFIRCIEYWHCCILNLLMHCMRNGCVQKHLFIVATYESQCGLNSYLCKTFINVKACGSALLLN